MDGNNIYHNGCSMFIGPKGEVLKEISDESGLIDMVLSKSELDEVRNDFPFLTNADSFSINL
jgi:predicted amidohydrolase